ncbi:hypothetical protein CF319_g7420 [Tilletia indica]|nr:hypothetical protein CF319_g7420 [Tilletia indica]
MSTQSSAITATTAASPPPTTLHPINPFIHIYDPTTQHEDVIKKAHQPSLLPGVRAPAVILVYGFMDGPMRIMSKYISQYTARFPTSTLILQLSTSKSFFATPDERTARTRKIIQLIERAQERAQSRRDLRRRIRQLERNAAERSLDVGEQRRLKKLKKLQMKAISGGQQSGSMSAASSGGEEMESVSSLRAYEEREDGEDAEENYLPAEQRTPRGLLIHSFSDGGARNLWAFLNELSSSTSTLNKRMPPIRALVLDSSPGYQTATTSSLAMTIPMRKKYAAWIVWLARAGIWAYVRLALWWRTFVRRQPTDSERMRAALNSPQKWAWGWPQASRDEDEDDVQDDVWQLPPRIYLYSRADVLIPWTQVERHAKDAARVQLSGGGGKDPSSVEPELIIQESLDLEKQEQDGGKKDDDDEEKSKSALRAASRAGKVDPETAKWAELSAKFDTSFKRERSTSSTTTSSSKVGAASSLSTTREVLVKREKGKGVRLARWEKAPHCDLGRHDLAGYWSAVDAWLAKV